jgi:invasion protein IalB
MSFFRCRAALRIVPLALVAGLAHAGDPVQFTHGDWELACDNTGTCRVAGYQVEDASAPVSVLLTRDAGAGAVVRGELQLGEDWSDDKPAALPRSVSLRIDGRAHGRVDLSGNDGIGMLGPAQVAALIAALRRDSRIEFVADKAVETWVLSDAGASAVLLKMDDAQGRVGTVGALQRKGARNESAVPPATPRPVVRAVGAVPAKRGDDAIATRHADRLRAALRAADPDQDCMALHDEPVRTDDGEPQPLEVHRLDRKRLLVTTRCWIAAYNAGSGYWIVDDTPPFRATLVTADANGLSIDASRVEIEAAHKGRGIGDCWSHDAWTWDGTRFVHTHSGASGMCRGFPGGAWRMPSLVTDVVKAGSTSTPSPTIPAPTTPGSK